jgi:hypothetical protein
VNNYVDLPEESGGSSAGVSSLNGLTGALTLIAGTGITITPFGSTLTIASSGSSGANTALSNLTSTAINADLVPGTPDTINLGSASLQYNTLWVDNITNSGGLTITSNGGSANIRLTTQPGSSGDIQLFPDTSGGKTNMQGLIRMTSLNNSTHVDVSTSNSTTAYAMVWPLAQGAASTVLENDGAGNLSWAASPAAGITALTGDGTATGPGSAALTLATVNSNVGSFTNANITVNAKGLITAASSGTSSVSSVTASTPLASSGGSTPNISLTGTIPIANGGTNATSVAGARTNLGIDAGATFITSGTTYTTPANITTNTQFEFTLIGGGGGGASSNAASTHSSTGGGASGCRVFTSGLSPSTAYTITIGAAGSGGASGSVGTDGGSTTLVIGATTYTAGGGNTPAAVTGAGGTGGTATNGTININGQAGSPSMAVFTSGGLSAGSSPWGWGLGGVGLPPSVSGAGNVGTGYGAGGGGSGGNGGFSGAAGTSGAILVNYWN